MSNGWVKCTVRKRTRERLRIDFIKEHKKNNPNLKNVNLGDDYAISFLLDIYFKPYKLQEGEENK